MENTEIAGLDDETLQPTHWLRMDIIDTVPKRWFVYGRTVQIDGSITDHAVRVSAESFNSNKTFVRECREQCTRVRVDLLCAKDHKDFMEALESNADIVEDETGASPVDFIARRIPEYFEGSVRVLDHADPERLEYMLEDLEGVVVKDKMYFKREALQAFIIERSKELQRSMTAESISETMRIKEWGSPVTAEERSVGVGCFNLRAIISDIMDFPMPLLLPQNMTELRKIEGVEWGCFHGVPWMPMRGNKVTKPAALAEAACNDFAELNRDIPHNGHLLPTVESYAEMHKRFVPTE
ncbi:MAG: hypothetical protein R8M45_06580 [Ghiorsea sp.]